MATRGRGRAARGGSPRGGAKGWVHGGQVNMGTWAAPPAPVPQQQQQQVYQQQAYQQPQQPQQSQMVAQQPAAPAPRPPVTQAAKPQVVQRVGVAAAAQRKVSDETVFYYANNSNQIKEEAQMDTSETMGAPTPAAPTQAQQSTNGGPATVTVEHPRLVLNRKLSEASSSMPGQTAQFEIVSETGEGIGREYTAKVTVNGQDFYGTARSHKLANKEAATKALLAVFNMKYEEPAPTEVSSPNQTTTTGDHPCNILNKKMGCVAVYDLVEEEKDPNLKGHVRVDVQDKSFYGRGATGKDARKDAAIKALFDVFKVKYEEPAATTPDGFTLSVEHPCNVLNRKIGQTAQFDIISQTASDGTTKEFTVKVNVENQDFFGVGPNQKVAKKDAATKALLNIYKVKFYEPMSVPSENGITITGENPLMVLNARMGKPADYKVVRYRANVTVNGQVFMGDGPSHKWAKLNAASKALWQVYNVRYDPDMAVVPPKGAMKRKAPADAPAAPAMAVPAAAGAAAPIEWSTEFSVQNGGPSPKKKLKGPVLPKNSLQKLNDMKLDLKYDFLDVEHDATPPTQQSIVYVCQVTINNNQTFIGRGKSKKAAKHASADLAILSFPSV